MTTDYRALCAELLQAWDDLPWEYDWKGNPVGPLAEIDDTPFERTRAALAQLEPVGPTDEELDELWAEIDGGGAIWAWQPYARAILARYGRPAITPIPVSERLPEAHDLSPCEPRICWCWDEPEGSWRLATRDYLTPGDLWLPYSAIADASAGQPAPTAPAP